MSSADCAGDQAWPCWCRRRQHHKSIYEVCGKVDEWEPIVVSPIEQKELGPDECELPSLVFPLCAALKERNDGMVEIPTTPATVLLLNGVVKFDVQDPGCAICGVYPWFRTLGANTLQSGFGFLLYKIAQ